MSRGSVMRSCNLMPVIVMLCEEKKLSSSMHFQSTYGLIVPVPTVDVEVMVAARR